MQVEQMTSPRSGRAVANQFRLRDDAGNRYFQSYETIIVKISNGKVYLDRAWECSNTTSRYRAEYLGETTAETRKKIESGEYIVTDLNDRN